MRPFAAISCFKLTPPTLGTVALGSGRLWGGAGGGVTPGIPAKGLCWASVPPDLQRGKRPGLHCPATPAVAAPEDFSSALTSRERGRPRPDVISQADLPQRSK